jgi:creatinine amidohydrolase
MFLASLTWKEFGDIASDSIVAVIPLGSTEQHGSIGPLGTDFTIPDELCKKSEAINPSRILVLPTMPYGVCPYHTRFSGTIDIGTPALQSVLTSIVKNMMNHGIRRFVFVNGHGGNDPAIEAACLYAFERGGMGAIIDWWVIVRELNSNWGGGHGGGQEASVMMAIRPEWVHKEKNFVPEKIYHLTDALQSTYGNATTFKGATVKIIQQTTAYSKTGTFGGNGDSCGTANAAHGKEIFDGMSKYLDDFLEEFSSVPLPKSHN